MKICDPCVPRSSRWQCWTLWAGLAAEHFIEPILGLDGDQDVIECVSGLLNPLTGRQSQHRHSGLNTPQSRSCWAIALSLYTQFHFILECCASTSENSLSSGNKGVYFCSQSQSREVSNNCPLYEHSLGETILRWTFTDHTQVSKMYWRGCECAG